MIVSKQKELKTIKEYLKDYKNIVIIGCGACAAACQTGGKDDVEAMAKNLRSEHTILLKVVVDETCHHLLTKKQLREHKETILKSDAILAMSCGAGVQSLSELFMTKKVIPSNDSHNLGNVIRAGQFKSYCSLCGDCTIEQTEGICVKTRCPKNHVNGPCGGMFDEKCEVYPDKDCVYVTIYKKQKEISAPSKKMALAKKDFSKRIQDLEIPRKK